MLKFQRTALFLAVLCVFAAAAYGDEIVVPFSPGEPTITQSTDGITSLSIPDYSSFTSPGDPGLPVKETYVLLPPNADLSSLRVEIRNAVTMTLPGAYSIAPTPPVVAEVDGKTIDIWGDKHIENGRDIDIYNRNEFYPSTHASVGTEGRLANYLLVPVQFSPYRYNPVTGELVYLESGQVTLTFNKLVTTASVQPTEVSQPMVDRLHQLAANSQQADRWYGFWTLATEPSATPLAIITTSAIVQASTKLTAFVTHKTNMGFNVTVATEADWGGGTGDVAAENIRNWLKNNYTTKASYALLIGNPNPTTGNVPMKMLWPDHGASHGYEDGPSDYYYADMTGNWDLDGDGYYGENPDDMKSGGVDRIPEVIVGRIPYYGVIADLDKILKKTITYETATSVGRWVQKMLLPMKPLDEYTPDWQLGEAIIQNVAKPAGQRYYRVYDSDYGIVPAPEKYPCTEANVLSEWQNGYGMVFWATHGLETLASDVFSTGSCPSLNDTKPSFVYQGSCLNGHPETTDNLGYSLLKNGAIAAVAASRVSWGFRGQSVYPIADSMPDIGYALAQQVVGQKKCFGDALFDAKLSLPHFLLWANHLVFNLYGDPTVRLSWPTSMGIDTSSIPQPQDGVPYSVQLNCYGGTLPYSWTISSGVLPTGLAISPDGLISGTPTETGSFTFSVRLSDSAGHNAMKNFTVEVRKVIYSFNLDSDPGWTYQGGWAFGTPTGVVSSGYADPTSGHSGSNVLGYNLSGGYPNGMTTTQYVVTAPFDCSNLYKTKLSFWRWLDVGIGDYGSVEISIDGQTWKKIWSNSSSVLDKTWAQVTYDISSTADGCPTVYIRWGMGTTNSSGSYPGWNIDDFEITGQVYKHVTTVPELKTLRDGTPFKLDEPMVVSAAYSGYFYMQQPNGYQGIKVWWSPTATEGASVTLRGTIGTNSGQKDIMGVGATFGTPGQAIRPVGISLLSLGGSSYGNPPFGQPGLDSTTGLNNIGTLVKVWGRVTQTSSSYFYIDDGSQINDGTKTSTEKNVGVRVQWPGTGLTRGQFVTIVGISSCFSDGTHYLRAIVPRKAEDIR